MCVHVCVGGICGMYACVCMTCVCVCMGVDMCVCICRDVFMHVLVHVYV